MISAEPREPYNVVATRGGVATGADHNTQHGKPQVRPTARKKTSLDVQQEKEVLLMV